MTAEGPLLHIREHAELDRRDAEFIRGLAFASPRILDLGAGRGGFVLEARKLGLNSFGLELQPEAVGLWNQLGIPGVVGDGLRTPFQSGSFDVVRMKEVLEHVPDPLLLIREAKRLLAPEGIVIIHVPSQFSLLYPVANFWDDYTHVRAFSKTSLARLIADAPLQLVDLQGYIAGRNKIEKVVGGLLAKVAPHVYRAVARKLPAASHAAVSE